MLASASQSWMSRVRSPSPAPRFFPVVLLPSPVPCCRDRPQGQPDLIAIATRTAGTLSHAGIVFSASDEMSRSEPRPSYRIRIRHEQTRIHLRNRACLCSSVSAQTVVSKKALRSRTRRSSSTPHADTPQRFSTENYDIGSTDPEDHGHISLDKPRWKPRCPSLSIWVEPETNQGIRPHTLDLMIPSMSRSARHPDRMMMGLCCPISSAPTRNTTRGPTRH